MLGQSHQIIGEIKEILVDVFVCYSKELAEVTLYVEDVLTENFHDLDDFLLVGLKVEDIVGPVINLLIEILGEEWAILIFISCIIAISTIV